MLTSKQRAELKSAANPLECIVQIGKGGINENLVKQVDDMLESREMIKIKVLETAPLLAREAAFELAPQTRSEVVQVIGRVIVLYRKMPKPPAKPKTISKPNQTKKAKLARLKKKTMQEKSEKRPAAKDNRFKSSSAKAGSFKKPQAKRSSGKPHEQ